MSNHGHAKHWQQQDIFLYCIFRKTMVNESAYILEKNVPLPNYWCSHMTKWTGLGEENAVMSAFMLLIFWAAIKVFFPFIELIVRTKRSLCINTNTPPGCDAILTRNWKSKRVFQPSEALWLSGNIMPGGQITFTNVHCKENKHIVGAGFYTTYINDWWYIPMAVGGRFLFCMNNNLSWALVFAYRYANEHYTCKP